MLFVDTGAGPMHCRWQRGDGGRAVVFLNVLGMDHRIWEGVLAHLPGIPTLNFDARGHGLSTSEGDSAMTRHVADVVALIDHFGLQEPILCGGSAGGLVALGVAGARPDLVGGLVLCNTAARIGTEQTWNERIAMVEAGGVEAIADGTMEKWFSSEFRESRPSDLAGWRTMLTRCPVEGYTGLCAAIRDTDFTGLAMALSVPVHVVGGTADGSTPPDVVEGLADLVPNAECTILDGAGHLPCIEAPADLAAIIGRFGRALQ